MKRLRYRAVRPDGTLVSGIGIARDPQDMRMQMNRAGLCLVSCRRVLVPSIFLFRKAEPAALLTFTIQLEQLLGGGLPVLSALTAIRDGQARRSSQRAALDSVLGALRGGQSLSGAFAALPHVFPATMVAFVQVGEESGTLTAMLAKNRDHLRWQIDNAARLRGVLMYPLLSGLVVLAVCGFLLEVLLPEAIGFMASLHQPIPKHTAWLAQAFALTKKYAVGFCLACIFAAAGITVLIRWLPALRLWIAGQILRLPVAGGLLRAVGLAHFCHVLAAMYSAGVPLVLCLARALAVVRNPAVRADLGGAVDSLESGRTLTASLEATGQFPALVLRLVEVGELAGSLERSLAAAEDVLNEKIETTLARLRAALAPALTLVCALLLGGVMVSVIGPIYATASAIAL